MQDVCILFINSQFQDYQTTYLPDPMARPRQQIIFFLILILQTNRSAHPSPLADMRREKKVGRIRTGGGVSVGICKAFTTSSTVHVLLRLPGSACVHGSPSLLQASVWSCFSCVLRISKTCRDLRTCTERLNAQKRQTGPADRNQTVGFGLLSEQQQQTQEQRESRLQSHRTSTPDSIR